MARKDLTNSERVKLLLRPDVVIPLDQFAAGPLDWLRLREALAERFRSSEDKAIDPRRSIQCMVSFKPETWAALNGMAERLQVEGMSASPSRLAELLIEAGLAQLQTA